MDKLLRSYLYSLYYTKIKTKLFGNTVKNRKREHLYDKAALNSRDAHLYIRELLESDKPMMIGRFGFTEIRIVGDYLMKKKGFKRKYSYSFDSLYNTAGFFSKENLRLEEDVDKLAELLIEASQEVDLIGASYATYEDYVINNYCFNSKITEFDHLRIMIEKDSWGKALENKNVLVIHPFEESIRSQFDKREKLWSNPNILPNFNLITYKAVQTIAGNNTEKFKDWFEALEYMIDDIKKIDFDVAIIGCGAYGFPLAAAIKRMGKKAFHLGGQTQLIFGILGKRWEDIPYYQQFINEYWTRPLEVETPKNFTKVEDGCYW